MITLQINNVDFTGFKSISVQRSIEQATSAFNINLTYDLKNLSAFYPIKTGDKVRVEINEEAILTGFVDSIAGEDNSNGHAITINGRGLTSDIIDSSLIGQKTFNAPVTLEAIARRVLDDNGLSNIKIINEAPSIAPFNANEFVSATTDETLFEFLEIYARKRQVLLTNDGEGNLVITRASAKKALTALVKDSSNNTNNVLSSSYLKNAAEKFNTYIVKSQLNTTFNNTSFFGETVAGKVSDQEGRATDSSIRSTRRLQIIAESSSDDFTCQERAQWEKSIRIARATTYTANLQGFFQDEKQTVLWKPNLLIQVKDILADIDTELLIKSVTYSIGINGGSITTLSCVDKDSYKLERDEEARADVSDKEGNLDFFGKD